jgi:hemophore
MRITALRRSLYAVFASCAAGGAAVAVLAVPSATAAQDPCAASEVAKTIGTVAINTGSYLDAHPQTNQALTTISQQQSGPQSLGALKNYFDANPQAGQDLQRLQQPLVNLSGRCRLPVTLPQLLSLMQSAQQGGALPGALGGATAGSPNAVSPAVPAPVSAVTAGTGPLPGPAASRG